MKGLPRLAMVCCMAALMVTTHVVSSAEAGGGINHKVTIANTTGYTCWVEVYYGGLNTGTDIDGYEYTQLNLGPNQSGYVQTGAKCARWIRGGCSQGAIPQFGRCTIGTETDDARNCTLTCWSSDWFIKKNADGSIRLDRE